jgi:hypothetical protein
MTRLQKFDKFMEHNSYPFTFGFIFGLVIAIVRFT